MEIDECFELLKRKIHAPKKADKNCENIDYIFDALCMKIENGYELPSSAGENECTNYFESESGYFYYLDNSGKANKRAKRSKQKN